MNVLISSIGRRVGLLRCFQEAFIRLALHGRVGGVDAAPHAPAAFAADFFDRVPRCDSPDFPARLVEVLSRRDIGLVVPTIDTELCFYAVHRERLGAVFGAASGPETVRLCRDKALTHAWLTERGLPVVRQAASAEEALEWDVSPEHPLIVKPRLGSASNGVRRVRSRAELAAALEDRPDLLAQECARGDEYTVNAYVNAAGECVAAIPHRRVEVRAGEVSKAVTVRHEPLIDVAHRIAAAMPDARGPLNIQAFVTPDDSIRIIEINPRFGGGYPLADRAGGRFTEWLIREARGEDPPRPVDDWRDGLAMLRYDAAVFVDGAGVL